MSKKNSYTRTFIEELIATQLIKKFIAFYAVLFFLKKGSGTHTVTQYLVGGGGGVSYTDVRRKYSGMPFWLASF